MSGVVITGGTRGIGAAVAVRLAKAGRPVAATFVANSSAADALAEQIRPTGTPFIALRGDATDADAMRAVAAAAHETLGSIDGLVLCASGLTSHHPGPVIGQQQSDLEEAVLRQLRAALTPIRAITPFMAKAGGGALVFVSASAATATPAGLAVLGTAKAATATILRYLAKEVGPSGIRINVVAPGMVRTEASSAVTSAMAVELAARTPLGRIANPADVAATIVSLLDAPFTTGATVPVDGGAHLT